MLVAANGLRAVVQFAKRNYLQRASTKRRLFHRRRPKTYQDWILKEFKKASWRVSNWFIHSARSHRFHTGRKALGIKTAFRLRFAASGTRMVSCHPRAAQLYRNGTWP